MKWYNVPEIWYVSIFCEDSTAKKSKSKVRYILRHRARSHKRLNVMLLCFKTFWQTKGENLLGFAIPIAKGDSISRIFGDELAARLASKRIRLASAGLAACLSSKSQRNFRTEQCDKVRQQEIQFFFEFCDLSSGRTVETKWTGLLQSLFKWYVRSCRERHLYSLYLSACVYIYGSFVYTHTALFVPRFRQYICKRILKRAGLRCGHFRLARRNHTEWPELVIWGPESIRVYVVFAKVPILLTVICPF